MGAASRAVADPGLLRLGGGWRCGLGLERWVSDDSRSANRCKVFCFWGLRGRACLLSEPLHEARAQSCARSAEIIASSNGVALNSSYCCMGVYQNGP